MIDNGKGDSYRPVNRDKWNAWWDRHEAALRRRKKRGKAKKDGAEKGH